MRNRSGAGKRRGAMAKRLCFSICYDFWAKIGQRVEIGANAGLRGASQQKTNKVIHRKRGYHLTDRQRDLSRAR
jgi:hypothetical protein